MINKEYFNISNNGIKIAQVSDLHEFDPSEVLEILENDIPDLILVTGDLLERKDASNPDKAIDYVTEETKKLYKSTFLGTFARFFLKKNHKHQGYDFLRKASSLAPIYYSLGNHEAYHSSEDLKLMKELNIILLHNKDIVFNKNGNNILIGGMSPSFSKEWLNSFSKKDGYKILMMHHPEYYEKYIKGYYDFNLILSGHAHGGQMQFLNKALYSPGQHFFPKYFKGLYDNKLLVSPGLSNTMRIPRINNPETIYYINI